MKQRMGSVRRRARRAFTLIELLAVIVILSILAYFLVTQLTGATRVMDVQVTRVEGLKIKAAISEYSNDMGDFPRSNFTADWGDPPNNVNLGAECLYLSLCADKAVGDGKFDESLVNVDGDQLARRVTGFEVLTLFELGDQWGNPFGYMHHRDYAREDQYQTEHPDTGESITSVLRAAKNPATGRYFEPRGFQLVSAGPDGEFGSDDDVPINFTLPDDKSGDDGK
jgi:prepilin-type N-terminal cleavage/methylation domain-containing protein